MPVKPKVLIAVISYSYDAIRGSHQAIRETWGKDVGSADLRFFMPQVEYVLQRDEVFVDVPGDYDHISQEVQEILRWSISKDYDFTFLCCNDLFCIPNKLFSCGFELYDYSGIFYPPNIYIGTTFTFDCNQTPFPNTYSWVNGGFGWFMSRKAAELVVFVESKYKSAGDIYIGQVLGPHMQSNKIRTKNIPLDKGICWHYRDIYDSTYDPSTGWMKKMYELYKGT